MHKLISQNNFLINLLLYNEWIKIDNKHLFDLFPKLLSKSLQKILLEALFLLFSDLFIKI